MNHPGYIANIEPDECRRLLGDAVVGRVAWVSTTHGIQVLPVTYSLVGDQIVFRVAEGSVLGELARPVEVAFQVDDLDSTTATGWAVLVHGSTSRFEGEPPSLRPWAPGVRDALIAIVPTSMSGRSVSADET